MARYHKSITKGWLRPFDIGTLWHCYRYRCYCWPAIHNFDDGIWDVRTIPTKITPEADILITITISTRGPPWYYHLLSRIFRFLPIVYQIESKSKLKPRGSSNDRFGSNTGAVLLLEIIYGMLMLWRWYEKKKDANQRTEISLTWNACNTRSLETNFISHVEQNDEI